MTSAIGARHRLATARCGRVLRICFGCGTVHTATQECLKRTLFEHCFAVNSCGTVSICHDYVAQWHAGECSMRSSQGNYMKRAAGRANRDRISDT